MRPGKQKVLALFSNSMEGFVNYHLVANADEFLETIEDLRREREEKAQNIIKRHLQQGTKDLDGLLNSGKNVSEKIIKEIIDQTHLPHRRIAELMGVNRGTIHGIAKK